MPDIMIKALFIRQGAQMAGRKDRVFIIAEISANHGQKFARAVEMIRAAKRCGADAVKFQAYNPDIITIDANSKYFRIKHPSWGNQTLYELYRQSYTPWNWFKRLKRVADGLGLVFFASAFDRTSVDFLEEIGVSCHKISSFELIDLPLIEYAAKTKKPIILSTGMATILEIKDAVSAAKKAGAKDITLMKCVSGYPAVPEEMNIRTIPDMAKRFDLPIGLSDHTCGTSVAVAAVSLGAIMVEKHFILSRRLKTPDSFFSVEPHEFAALVSCIRTAEKALGKVHYGLTKGERDNRIFRRSIFAVRDIVKGSKLTQDNVKSIRPAYGIAPKYYKKVLGKNAARNIRKGTPLTWDVLI
ncbi:MAG: pseudaminic acid synthase [Candidatus Omnitrophota bacterium]|nr:pseudaminic acid synthase [Candidatus Omnitrophota bacterium]